jgi:hypothetical protein
MHVTSISFKSEDPRCVCPKCGGRLHRLARKGFFQSGVYPRFGYYPWECLTCREKRMLRTRDRRPVSHPSPSQLRSELPVLAPAAKVQASAPPEHESAPPPIAEESIAAESILLPLKADAPDSLVLDPLPMKAEAPDLGESESLDVLRDESPDLSKSGPLRFMKAEPLHVPKRESMRFRKRESARSLSALPPVSEAAIQRAIFAEDSLPERSHLPAAPQVSA